MPQYLSQQDVLNYGEGLVDFSQRAALNAVAPHLQHMRQQNAELERELAIERRQRLDAEVDATIPNWREIDNDHRWHNWLRMPNPLTGTPRQFELDAAISSGDATRVRAFFRGFQNEHGAGHGGHHGSSSGRSRPGTQRGPSAAPSDGANWTRPAIAEAYRLHMKGKLVGDEWNRIEQSIIQGLRRIESPVPSSREGDDRAFRCQINSATPRLSETPLPGRRPGHPAIRARNQHNLDHRWARRHRSWITGMPGLPPTGPGVEPSRLAKWLRASQTRRGALSGPADED
jgi:hypothetical protein